MNFAFYTAYLLLLRIKFRGGFLLYFLVSLYTIVFILYMIIYKLYIIIYNLIRR